VFAHPEQGGRDVFTLRLQPAQRLLLVWPGVLGPDGFEQAYVISEEATADLVGLSRLREPLPTVGA